MRELNLLDALWEIITPVDTPGSLGPGDDAAVVNLGSSANTVISVDQTVSGVHADPRFVTPNDFGWRAVTTALSDLAAMGSTPEAVLIGLIFPADTKADDLKALATGADAAAVEAGARIFGGDVSTGPVLTASVTVVGSLRDGRPPVTRSAAEPGDLVGVTGMLGGSAAGLELLRANPSDPDGLRYRRPSARVNEGIALASAGVTSMIDISDGIATDAGHLGRASGARLDVDLMRLPIDPICHRAAESTGADPHVLAATGGEDFELLFTAPAAQVDAIEAAADLSITWVGEVVAGEGGTSLSEAGLSGWQH